MSGKVAKGVSWLKTVMLLWAALVGFKILAAFGQENTARGIVEAIFMFIGAFLVTGIPAFILGWATGKDEPPISEPGAVSVTNPAGDSNSEPYNHVEQARVSGDAAYAQALSEIETGQTDKALWARAFAEADGDENRVKAAYIKSRAARLLTKTNHKGTT